MKINERANLLFPTAVAALLLFTAGIHAQTRFRPIDIDFPHVWDKSEQPFTGAAVIDIDGDGIWEVFIGGGKGQPDGLFRFEAGELTNVIEGSGLSSLEATHGATAIDMDADGDTDMLIARGAGAFLYLNEGGRFTASEIPYDRPEQSVPFHIAVSDIDHDGDGDLYISNFVAFPHFKSATFNDPSHAKANRLLLNNGDLTFTDITASSNTAGAANTFCSTFVDLDGDTWEDLVVAQNTWEVEIFRNNRDTSFTSMASNSGYGFWMGAGVGDMDSDGDQDLFFPNVGTTIPVLFTRGDIRKDQRHSNDWALLRNDGNFSFTDVTAAYGLGKQGFGWGGVFEDADLDGKLDLFVAQNYVKWPFHKVFKLRGQAMLQKRTETGAAYFQDERTLGLVNKHFGQSSLFVDLNGDGRQDYLWINMDDEQQAYLSAATENFITFVLPDTVAALGARTRITTSVGGSYTRTALSSHGYLTDQTPEVTFGLGAVSRVDAVFINTLDGREITILEPKINQKHYIKF